MATLNYNTLQGQTLYDIACLLYNDFSLGIQDLMTLNNLSLGTLPSVILYTPGLSRVIPKYNIPIVDNPNQEYIIFSGQSIYDLAVQIFGGLEGIGNLLGNVTSLNQNPVPGQVITYLEDLQADNAFFLSNIVAT